MKRGFTLIEIVIVMALILIFGTIGTIFGIGVYGRSLCHSERDTLVSLLYKVRGRAMNNRNHVPQGLHFENDKYVIFSGSSYEPGGLSNEITGRSSLIPISSSVLISGHLPRDIIFDQLTGNVDSSIVGSIFIGGATSTCHDIISLNHEGGIDW